MFVLKLGIVVGSLMWVMFGFSFTYGRDNGGFIGSFEYGLFFSRLMLFDVVNYYCCCVVFYRKVSNTQCYDYGSPNDVKTIPAGAFASNIFVCVCFKHY